MNNHFYFHSAPSKKGRVTIAGVLLGGSLRIGAAKCSAKDQFNRQQGRNMALERAVSNLQVVGVKSLRSLPKEMAVDNGAGVTTEVTISPGKWFLSLAKETAANILKGRINAADPNGKLAEYKSKKIAITQQQHATALVNG
jgi:hypothetical protein